MRTVGALWRSSHPGPTLVVTALSLALGISIGLDSWRLALLVVAVFAGQLSVGISNDAFDADRDRAVGRIDKPLASPRGWRHPSPWRSRSRPRCRCRLPSGSRAPT